MSNVLYYSNFCENCKKLLYKISKSSIKNNIHFICIDKRTQKNNNIYIILENNNEIILPPTINAVPALLLVNNNYKVLFGDDILHYLKPVEDIKIEKNITITKNEEPTAYHFGNYTGVVSDTYSFLDQNNNELAAQGNGGLRQLYNYATINHLDKIETPPEDYVPDKIGDINIENIEYQRNNNI